MEISRRNILVTKLFYLVVNICVTFSLIDIFSFSIILNEQKRITHHNNFKYNLEFYVLTDVDVSVFLIYIMYTT